MTESIIGLFVGIAALIAAFLVGRNQQKQKTKIEDLEGKVHADKLSEAIRKANDAIPDNDLRKWMRDNAKK
jgi:biopolymer transport protein ExbB/TolQ